METCLNPKCQKPLPTASERCPACGTNNGLPNLRQARRDAPTLEMRYQAALDDCQARQVTDIAIDFTQAVSQHSRAVLNGNPLFFHAFIKDDRNTYSTYSLQLEGEMRIAAPDEHHAERQAVEAQIFPSYGKAIRYAALSLNGLGPHSYGSCSLTINPQLCENLASLTEENTYELAKHHGKNIPPGYRSTWDERHKLALAKLAGQIVPNTMTDQYPTILLFSEGKRATDQFIEVHLYGPFTCHAIESANIAPTGKDKTERYELEILADELTSRGIPWQRQ
jgi:hypothetical protein